MTVFSQSELWASGWQEREIPTSRTSSWQVLAALVLEHGGSGEAELGNESLGQAEVWEVRAGSG